MATITMPNRTTMSSLCQLASDWNGAMPAGGALVEEKVDGWRAICLPGQGAMAGKGGWRFGRGAAHRLHDEADAEGVAVMIWILAGSSATAGKVSSVT